MQRIGDEPQSNGPFLSVVAASILRGQGSVKAEVTSGSHVNTMFGNIGFVLCLVELDPKHI
jgi:hypothetical protein